MHGSELEALCTSSGLKSQLIYERAGFNRGHFYKILKKKDVSVDEFVRITTAIGIKPGDLLTNSAAQITPEVRPILDSLTRMEPRLRARTLRIIEEVAGIQDDMPRGTAAVPANVKPFPQREQEAPNTEPRWTEGFPIDPSVFKIRDVDFPRELHAVPVEVINAAAGGTGVMMEIDMPQGWLLHDKAVRDETHRVVKVSGDSMAPDVEDGWKLLVDLRKRTPRNDDFVLIGIQDEGDEGGMLGYWEAGSNGPRLIKANTLYKPIELTSFRKWFVAGTIEKVVDAPVKKRRKK